MAFFFCKSCTFTPKYAMIIIYEKEEKYMLFENINDKAWGELTDIQKEVVMKYAKITDIKNSMCELVCPEDIGISAELKEGKIIISDTEKFRAIEKNAETTLSIREGRKRYLEKNKITPKSFYLNAALVEEFITFCLDNDLSQVSIVEQCMMEFCKEPNVDQQKLDDMKSGDKKSKTFKVHEEILDNYTNVCKENGVKPPLQLCVLLENYMIHKN